MTAEAWHEAGSYLLSYVNILEGRFMKRINFTFFIVAIAILTSVMVRPITVSAWGDNYVDLVTGEKGRPSYTIDQINNGAIGATKLSDGEDYKNSSNYPGQIIFNTISNSTIGDEKNFVGARECALDGTRCLDIETNANSTPTTKWQGNNITVEDGKTYVIRLYVHNNSPNGYDAVAEDVRVSFSIPNEYDNENKRIQVNGFIYSSNASPSEYWDYVNFNSDTPFRLDYVYGSALLNNNKTYEEAAAHGDLDHNGWVLSDDIVKAASVDGILIGSDALDGRVPGGYQHASYVTIIVKAVFGTAFTTETRARIANSDDSWLKSVDTKVGDKVEFRIEYKNISDDEQNDVVVKDILPSNLKYIEGSATLKNDSNSGDAYILNDALLESGIRIDNYDVDASNAHVYFIAEVVNDDLDQGLNILKNWAQFSVEGVTIRDSVEIRIRNDTKYHMVMAIHIIVIVICLIIFIISLCKTIKHRKIIRRK